MNRISFYPLALGVLLTGCSELVHTQVNEASITLEHDSMLADGTTRQLIEINFGNELAQLQPVLITTTNGKLYSFPISASSRGTTDTLVLTPRARKTFFYLESSLQPEENVILSTTINRLMQYRTIKFTPACPDDVKLSFSMNRDSLYVGDTLDVTFTLLRDNGRHVSTDLRIDCVSSENLVKTPNSIYSDETGVAHATLEAQASGTDFVVFAFKGHCANVVPPVKLTISPQTP